MVNGVNEEIRVYGNPGPGQVASYGTPNSDQVELEQFILRPGDTLIIRLSPHASRQQIDIVKAHLERELPGTRAIIIAAEQLTIYRDSNDSDA